MVPSLGLFLPRSWSDDDGWKGAGDAEAGNEPSPWAALVGDGKERGPTPALEVTLEF